MTIQVVLADDHAIVRAGLCALLEAQPDIRVIATAANGREAVTMVLEHRPTVVVMDINMPDMSGIEAARRIAEHAPGARVLILSMHSNSEHVHQALKAGATGYLLKESAGGLLVDAVRAVHAGRRYLDGKIKGDVITDMLGGIRAKGPLDSLSPRERAILHLVVQGRSNAEAAKLLSLSTKTVETYRSRMMQKLCIEDVPSLVKFAIEHGLTQLK